MSARGQLHIRAKPQQLLPRQRGEWFGGADLAPACVTTGVILSEALVNLGGQQIVHQRSRPGDGVQIPLEMRANRAVDATLPMTNRDWLLDPDRSRHRLLGKPSRLAMSRETPPFRLLHGDPRLVPQFRPLHPGQHALARELPHVCAANVEIVCKTGVDEGPDEIDRLDLSGRAWQLPARDEEIAGTHCAARCEANLAIFEREHAVRRGDFDRATIAGRDAIERLLVPMPDDRLQRTEAGGM